MYVHVRTCAQVTSVVGYVDERLKHMQRSLKDMRKKSPVRTSTNPNTHTHTRAEFRHFLSHGYMRPRVCVCVYVQAMQIVQQEFSTGTIEMYIHELNRCRACPQTMCCWFCVGRQGSSFV